MEIDNLGIPQFDDNNLVDIIYTQELSTIHNVQCKETEHVKKFNSAVNETDIPPLQIYKHIDIELNEFDKICQSQWFMPQNYYDIDVIDYVINKVPNQDSTSVEYIRAAEELYEFEKRGMFPILKYMIYLVNFMKDNNILWGVGRGSSVSSYVLFLIGVHRINSLKYSLDWREFLR